MMVITNMPSPQSYWWKGLSSDKPLQNKWKWHQVEIMLYQKSNVIQLQCAANTSHTFTIITLFIGVGASLITFCEWGTRPGNGTKHFENN